MLSTIAIQNVAVQNLEKGESMSSDLPVFTEKFWDWDWMDMNVPVNSGSSVSVLEINLFLLEAQMRREAGGDTWGKNCSREPGGNHPRIMGSSNPTRNYWMPAMWLVPWRQSWRWSLCNQLGLFKLQVGVSVASYRAQGSHLISIFFWLI